ncbi:NAD(P)-dependent alcohol dehydrogenase [Brooklawnia cerclae]|uniref:(R,R)-butanediol dehydrogenase/meso-butanediol dehydrogenase/diacetyl reductase/L-iditol 2-dehydrogenase n=1 Tax=Brooklawnia cerclae TaxID=349934 RepID=A0ABX0SH14_9ACTN|nr:alcohol dehydrogenase catalytic domain-containing protein [Brooklawnia cerclae]NIH57250.1 (R,R)-butanediol dehydrogenase/meso-butanediol dehydrogenase/diacetyl reductase/L-iditol 2-dehydrogenase [Brooklawnia cerclae]
MRTVAITKMGRLNHPDLDQRGKVEVIDFPEQEVGPEDVKIRLAYAAICGSDPHLAEGAFSWDVPQGLGHEVSGIVEEIGPRATVNGLKVGDRVACNFLRFCGTCHWCRTGRQQFCTEVSQYQRPGMAEYVVWHESQVYKLPDSVGLLKGCLLEPVSVGVRMMDKLKPKAGDRVLVCGGGPIGQIATQLLARYGATSLTMVEPIAARRELAKGFGAVHVIDPTAVDVVEAAREITGGLGYDVVLDASGSVRAAPTLPLVTARGGTLIYGAMYPNEFEMPFNIAKICYFNELTISGLFVSPYAFPRALQLLPELDLDVFTQAVFPLERATEAFEVHMSGAYPKVIVQCNELN